MKLQEEHEALKKRHAEDNGKAMFLIGNEEFPNFLLCDVSNN